jgi:hypothetical protein
VKEVEIVIGRGGTEKKIIISSGIISYENSENSINSKYDLSLLVVAGNGAFSPPFEKGSKVVQEIRATSGHTLKDWRLVFPIQQNESDYFRFNIDINEYPLESVQSKNWGVWICETSSGTSFPDIMLLNFPLWILRNTIVRQDDWNDVVESFLSRIYRIILSGISAVTSFKSANAYSSRCIAFSDIGNNLIDRGSKSTTQSEDNLNESFYKARIRAFTQVLSDWLSKTEIFNKAIIAYGGGFDTEVIERAWDMQAEDSKDEISEFGDALVLREKNAVLLKHLMRTTKSKSLASVLEMSADSFQSPHPSLSADLLQSRTLVEGISKELCGRFGLKAQEGNLYAYIQRLEESKKISPWVTSYIHVIRQLGNEAAHFRSSLDRRPERPVGRDLIVIHAALNRILTFCIDENL